MVKKEACCAKNAQSYEVYAFKDRTAVRKPVWYKFSKEQQRKRAFRTAEALKNTHHYDRIEIHCKCESEDGKTLDCTTLKVFHDDKNLDASTMKKVALFIGAALFAFVTSYIII